MNDPSDKFSPWKAGLPLHAAAISPIFLPYCFLIFPYRFSLFPYFAHISHISPTMFFTHHVHHYIRCIRSSLTQQINATVKINETWIHSEKFKIIVPNWNVSGSGGNVAVSNKWVRGSWAWSPTESPTSTGSPTDHCSTALSGQMHLSHTAEYLAFWSRRRRNLRILYIHKYQYVSCLLHIVNLIQFLKLFDLNKDF